MPREKSTAEGLKDEVLEGILKQQGFTPQFRIAGSEDTRHEQLSVSVSCLNVSAQVNGVCTPEVAILEASNPSDAARTVANQLATELEQSSYKPKRLKWGSNLEGFSGKNCVSLVELDTPLLENIAEQDFLRLKQIVGHASDLLWVTSLGSPGTALSTGMARSIRNELPSKGFRTLSIQPKSIRSPERVSPLILKLIASSTPEFEFLEKDGILHKCRVVEDGSMSEEMERMRAGERERVESIPLEQAQGPHKLAVKAQGMLDSLCLEPDDAQGQIESDEVVIDVKATGLK